MALQGYIGAIKQNFERESVLDTYRYLFPWLGVDVYVTRTYWILNLHYTNVVTTTYLQYFLKALNRTVPTLVSILLDQV